jgi:menaquinone-dependent protoporphyrinogen oxidase
MVLVTYTTKYGSTEEVVHAVAMAMREAGVQVEIKPMRGLTTLDAYDGVVLGTALYMTRLHGDARRFLSSHRDALGSRRVTLFALGPVNNVEKEWDSARLQLKKQLAKFPWFVPISTEVFGGKYDPMKLGLVFSLFPVLRKMPAVDARDWGAIRAWAKEHAAALQPVLR